MIKVLLLSLIFIFHESLATYVIESTCHNSFFNDANWIATFPGLVRLKNSVNRKDFETIESAIEWLNELECEMRPRLFLKRKIPLEQVKVGSKMEEKQVTVRKRVVREVKKWYSNHSFTGR